MNDKATPNEIIVSRPDFCYFTCGRVVYYHQPHYKHVNSERKKTMSGLTAPECPHSRTVEHINTIRSTESGDGGAMSAFTRV